jgi:uncharacterized membrane protein YeaQ/YmgE (transglycosylase-associated protein family)
MGIITWLVLGLIAGFIASKIVNHTGSGIIMDIVLGVIGAFVGGFLFNFFGHTGVTGFNLYSALVATLGAIVVLFLYHAIAGRRNI